MSATVTMERADRVAQRVEERELDCLLVSTLHNVRWVTGFTGSSAAAVVGREGTRRFVTDFRYLTQSAEELDPAWEREIAVDLLAGVARRGLDPPLRLGVDDAHLSVKDHARLTALVAAGVELVPAGGLVEGLRARKDPGELDRIRGAEAAAFPPIVAAAEHGALPHATPRDLEIPAGTFCVIDWGAQLDGYTSDCTRTFPTGEIDPRDREVYELVLRAQEAALAAVRPGPTGREVDAVARAIIDAAGHAEHFGHGLGHGVGLDVHEGPRLSKQGDAALEEGMVVTIEPGVYVPGAVGVRIEDLVIVTDDGCEVVTSLPKDI